MFGVMPLLFRNHGRDAARMVGPHAPVVRGNPQLQCFVDGCQRWELRLYLLFKYFLQKWHEQDSSILSL